MELLIISFNRIGGAARAASLFILLLLLNPCAYAKGIYQTGPEFIAATFGEQQAEFKSLWLTAELKGVATRILSRPVRELRVRYWQRGEKTAWIMEEIGKELPITIGVVIDQNQIQQLKILAYRESRGGEVRYSAFTSQYQNATMTADHRLDRNIDGITGATLSVKAVTRVSRLALYYHQQIAKQATANNTTPAIEGNTGIVTP